MSRIDDELGLRFQRAAEPIRTDNVVSRVAARRKAARRSLPASRVVLVGAVLVGTLAAYAGLQRAFTTAPDTVAQGTVSLVPGPAEASHVAGVPYPVCRVMRISGDFGLEQLDTAWVFQEEHFPGQGCLAGEGFQHLAIGSATGVEQISDRLTACSDLSDCWPAAAVDLDADGVDEIAIGAGWSAALELVFYRLERHDGSGVTLEPIEAVCEPTENCTKRFTIDTSDGSEAGVYCGMTMTGPATDSGLVAWRLDEDGDGWWFHQFELTEQGFANAGHGLVTHGQPGNYSDVGAEGTSLCGEPLMQLDDIDPERAQHVVELLGELITP